MSAVKTSIYERAIEDDVQLGHDMKAAGTPHFFINGRRLVGAQKLEKFKTLIDEELKTWSEQKPKVAAKDYYDRLMATAKGAPLPAEKSATPPAQPAPFIGAANGKVVIQEFGDFQCPYCARSETTLEELVKAYPTQVKVVWRDLPLSFHTHAALAAEAAREAHAQQGNAGFAKMKKLLFEHQHPDVLERPALEAYAAQVGLDMAKFRNALDSRVHKRVVDAEAAAAASAGISGTPAFLVGPYYISGAQPLVKFRQAVELVLHPPAGD